MNDTEFVKAVGLARAGQKAEARGLLLDILEDDSSDELVWLWLAECVNTPEERLQVLETCLEVLPDAERARFRLAMLRHEERQSNTDKTKLGRAQLVSTEGQAGGKENKSLSLDEWRCSVGAKVFTVPPEQITAEEFARIVQGCAG